MPTSLSYCADLVLRGDRDRFLMALTVPAVQREAVLALYAFNLEISRIPEAVSEEMIGFIRYAWWREALDELYDGKKGRAHAVIQALQPLIAGGRLSRRHFDRLMDARQQQFSEPGFKTLAAFRQYLADTNAPLLYLCLEALGLGAGNLPVEEIAVAYGTIGSIRAMATGAFTLPEELAMPNDKHREALQQAAKLLASQAVLPSLPQRHVLLSAYITHIRHYAKRLQRLNHNPFDPRLAQGKGGLAAKLWLLAAIL